MCEQCNAPAAQRRTQSAFGDESIDAKFHGGYVSVSGKCKTIGMVEIRFAGWMSQAPIRSMSANLLYHCRDAEPPHRAFREQYLIQFYRRAQNEMIPARLDRD